MFVNAMATTKKTPLHNWHVAHGAKMVEFGGWMMPVSYSGVLEEHRVVRERCGLFDISHMGEVYLSGKDVTTFLQWLTTNDVSRLKDGLAQYSLILDERGFPIDDIIVYRLTADQYMLCVNAANTEKDVSWIQQHLKGDVHLDDRSEKVGLIALQGPKSFDVLARLHFDLNLLKRFEFKIIQLQEIPVSISRTGYTGEEGVECFVENQFLLPLWKLLMQHGQASGIQPIGLGARDTLRLEMGYPLYGHELSPEISPLEAGLHWVVKLEKGDFLGRSALLKQKEIGIPRKLVGLRMEEKGIPRENFPVISKHGEVLGKTLSGTFSLTLQTGIATALLECNQEASWQEICIDIRGKMKKAKIASLPFLSKKKRRVLGANFDEHPRRFKIHPRT
jgi:aminomethyltransferase